MVFGLATSPMKNAKSEAVLQSFSAHQWQRPADPNPPFQSHLDLKWKSQKEALALKALQKIKSNMSVTNNEVSRIIPDEPTRRDQSMSQGIHKNCQPAQTARPIYRSTEWLWRSNYTYTSEMSINPEADDIEEIKLDEHAENTKNLLSHS